MYYSHGMRVRTSITLAEDVVHAIDEIVQPGGNRSRLIEDALREYLERRARVERDARDAAILDRVADKLNAEMEDVLAYQADL